MGGRARPITSHGIRGVGRRGGYRPAVGGTFVQPERHSGRLPLREVPCASCGAEPGQVCTGIETGTPVPSGHQPRRRLAARLAAERREQAQPRTPPTPSEQSVRVVSTVALGVRSWHAECDACGWSCRDAHEDHWREVTAVSHAERHVCPVSGT